MTEPQSVSFSPAFQEELKVFIEDWFVVNKDEGSHLERRNLLQQELQAKFNLEIDSAYVIANDSLDHLEENLVNTQNDISIDKTNSSTIMETNIDKIEHVLKLNMKHDYFKLEDDEFTTIRGKYFFYKYFDTPNGSRRLMKGDIVRIDKKRKLFSYCEISGIDVRAIANIPLVVLQKDGDYPNHHIKDKQDFVYLINSFLPSHYKKATVESEKTVLTLRKLKSSVTIDKKVVQEEDLVNTQNDISIDKTEHGRIDKKFTSHRSADLVNKKDREIHEDHLVNTTNFIDKKVIQEEDLVNTQNDISIDKIYVTYCGFGKSNQETGTSQELYTSQRVKSFFKRFPQPRAILSYKYGIIAENQVIDNYNMLNFQDIEVAAQKVKDFVGQRELVFYSPRKLTEDRWIDLLNKSGVNYSVIRSYKEILLESTIDKNVLQDKTCEEKSLKFIKKGEEIEITPSTRGLLKRFKTCGKPTCRCVTEGKQHGPYYILVTYDPSTGKQKQKYLGRAS